MPCGMRCECVEAVNKGAKTTDYPTNRPQSPIPESRLSTGGEFWAFCPVQAPFPMPWRCRMIDELCVEALSDSTENKPVVSIKEQAAI